MGRRREATGAEWVGDIVSMPTFITGEGEPYRPSLVIWVEASGDLVGFDVAKPSDATAAAIAVLRTAMERPRSGPPRGPARLRVSSEPLAEALRTAFAHIPVARGSTPELDALAAHLSKQFAQAPGEESYLENDVGPGAVGAFFRAMAGLFRAAPWKHVPGDLCLLSVGIPALGVTDRVISVIGQLGESLGLIVFDSMDDFDAYRAAATTGGPIERRALPGHLSLNFDRGGDLQPALRKEIATHRWEVAGPTAYPKLTIVEAGLVARAPVAKEIQTAEALALALPRLLAERDALHAAWWAAEPMKRTFRVETHGGPIDVTLQAPHDRSPHREEEEEPAWGDDDDGLLDEDHDLLDRFFSSPEGQGHDGGVDACRAAMAIAGSRFGAPLVELAPGELEEVVFDGMPEAFDAEPEDAADIIAELRAFYRFAEREELIPRVRAHLAVLGPAATRRLKEGLGDPKRFGPDKTVIQAGRAAGFDVDTPEGREAWLSELNGAVAEAAREADARGRGEKKKSAKAKQKQKRKAARKARRAGR